MAFEDFDFTGFWLDSPYSVKRYTEGAPSDELVAEIERELGGYLLPASYVELSRRHNGGIVTRSCHPLSEATLWVGDHIEITGLYAIGRTADRSLCGPLGSTFMAQEWGYPPIGVGIADTPSAGHEQIMLDYRDCGATGEPQVVHVDQEQDYRITFVAKDFETFIRGLVRAEVYDTSEQDRRDALAAMATGTLSPIVEAALARVADRLPEGERRLRALGMAIVQDKGYFALHADERSYIVYDLLFWLYSALTTARSFRVFLTGPEGAPPSYDTPCYERMIALPLVEAPFGFTTRGYAEAFVRGWWDARVATGDIVESGDGSRMSPEAEQRMLGLLRRL